MNRLESMAVAPLWWSVGLRSGCLASVGPASFGFQSGFSRSFVVRRSYEGSWLRSQKSWRCVGHAPVGRRVRRAGRQRWSPTSTSSFWPSVLALRSARSSFFASAAQAQGSRSACHDEHEGSLCFALPCFALLPCALTWFALLCFAVRCSALLCCASLCLALLCLALRCLALPSFAFLCFALLCCSLLCIALLCVDLLCFALR